MTIELTNQCSLDCIHCSTESVKEGVFMLSSHVERVLESFPEFGKVRFSGGEPFEHPQIVEILSMAKGVDRNVQVLSSGVYYDKSIPYGLIEDCSSFIDEVVFSMHGMYSHDFITSTEGSWSKLLNSSAVWMEPFNVAYSFECVLTKQVFEGLEDLVTELYHLKKGCPSMIPHLHVLRLIKQGRALENWDVIAPTEEQVISLPSLAESLSDDGIKVTYSKSFVSNPEMVCDCGLEKTVIQWDGTVIPCSALKGYLGEAVPFACRDRF
ncbi:MAG: radical SAM protein [Nanoarchaeota archaeon]|nr:radical SAM protein [Nanoarchaeota archaeon]